MMSKLAEQICDDCKKEAEANFPKEEDQMSRLAYQVGLLGGKLDVICYNIERIRSMLNEPVRI